MRRTRFSPKFKAVLAVLISLQMTLGTYADAANQTAPGVHGNSPQTRNQVGQAAPGEGFDAWMGDDPFWQEFAQARLNPAAMRLRFSAEDPAIDRDPFFLRAQTWAPGPERDDRSERDAREVPYEQAFALYFHKVDGAVEIALPAGHRVLRLNLPMTPVHATDDFIFLSVDRGSDLFAKAAGAEEPGEGLFFISREDLAARAMRSQPVPIFFLPLPGKGWTGNITAHEIPQVEILAVANQENTAIALELKDVETTMKAQQINLLLATAVTMKNKRGRSDALFYPAPGMTAAFGLFFTGLDLDEPAKSFWVSSEGISKVGGPSVLHSLLASVLDTLPLRTAVRALWPEKAQAFEFPEEAISRIVFVGSVLTAMLALSVVLKYAHPGIRRKIHSLRKGEEPTSTLGKLRREGIEVLDVYAHMTTTVAQFPVVTFANSVELFLDRFAPGIAAGEHTLIRRFMNNTFYAARDLVKSTPVSARTFFYGAIVLNNVDTAMVVFQYLVAVPYLCLQLAPFLDVVWQNKINAVFDPSNPNTNSLIIQDSVRNELSGIQNGASSYAKDRRAQVLLPIEREIDAYMRAIGKDPTAPEHQSERNRLIEDKVDIVMQQRALPAKKQFLFDANTLFANLPKMHGHQAQEKESFILATRFGLTVKSVERALRRARENARVNPSPEASQAVAILEETLEELSFVRNIAQKGLKKGVESTRKLRRRLTLLSYEGSVELAVRYVPDIWKVRYSPAGAQLASLFFRHSLFSYLVEKEADLAALVRKGQTSSDGVGKGAEREVTQALQESAESVEPAPPRFDWLARRQHKRAERYANEKLGLGTRLDSPGEWQQASAVRAQKKWKRYYRDGLAAEVGLHLKNASRGKGRQAYTKMLKFVEKQAEEITQVQLKTDHGLVAYLESVSPFERVKVEAALYAVHFLQVYKDAATENEMIAPLDPMQPGRFQKIRQSSRVSQSPILTRTLRVFEAFGDDQALSPGWGDYFRRNVPLFSDMWSTHQRLLKTFLSSVSVNFLWNYYAWQVHIPYATVVLFVALSASTISAPSQWLDRVFRTNGVRPMGGVMAFAKFGFIASWVTFFGMIPGMLFSEDANRIFADSIRDPFLAVWRDVPIEPWMEMAGAAGLAAVGVKTATMVVRGSKAKAASQRSQRASNERRRHGGGLMCREIFVGP